MKRAIFALFLSIGCYWNSTIQAQTVTLSVKEMPLPEILNELSRQTQVYFSYANNNMPDDSISITVNQEYLSDVLNRLLTPFGLGFEYVETSFIVIKPIEELGVRLEVVVADVRDGSPLPFAQLKLVGQLKGTQTDTDGVFSYFFRQLSSQIELSYLGYTTAQFSVEDVYKNQVDTLYLQPNAIQLEGIVITEYLNYGITARNDGGPLTLTPSAMNVLPGLSEPDALYSLQLLPGIYSSDESATSINIRGGTSDQVALYWEQIPVYHSAHYFGLISSFIPTSVDHINVYRNRVPVQFGGSASGLVEMISTQTIPERMRYQFDVNMTHVNASTLIPIAPNRLSVYVAARRSINDVVLSPTYTAYNDKLFNGTQFQNNLEFAEDEAFDTNDELRFWDVNTKLLWKPNESNTFSASGFSGSNTFDFASIRENLLTADFQRHVVHHRGANAAWKATVTSNWSSEVSVARSEYDLDYDFLFQRAIELDPTPEFVARIHMTADEDDESDDETEDDADDEDPEEEEPDDDEEEDDEENEEELDDPNNDDDEFNDRFTAPDSLQDRGTWRNRVINTELRWTNTITSGAGIWNLGAQFNLLDLEYALREENTFSPDISEGFEERSSNYSLFGNYRTPNRSRWGVQTGFRLNYFNAIGVTTFDPQISNRFMVSPWVSLKGNASISHQFIRSLSNLDNSLANTTEEIWFSPDVQEFPLIRNQQVSAGFIWQRDGWLLDVEAYSKQLDGLNSANYNFGGVTNEFVQGEEQIYGVDVLLRRQFRSLRTWVSYSYSDAKSYFPDVQDTRFPSFLDRPHQFSVVQSVTKNRWEWSLGWTFRSGAPYSEPISDLAIRVTAADDNDADTDDEVFYLIEYGDIHAERLPNYHRLDASVWYHIQGNSGWKGKVGLSVLNVYNRQNILNRVFFPEQQFGLEPDEVDIIQEDRFLLGFTPNVTVSVSF
ncbi:MAG: carboxypeptidase-like regulatory domain-containing protein [Bacteroidota bacterium]